MGKKSETDVEARRQAILKLLQEKGKVRCSELSKQFDISEVTARNDLLSLEKKGLLERVHGGAVQETKSSYNMVDEERKKKNGAEKIQIAEEVAAMISDGETIMVNAGTTVGYILERLRHLNNLTIVTNSISIAVEYGTHSNFNVILLGGYINGTHLFTYGGDTIRQLQQYRADKLILSVDGVDAQKGITTYYFQEVDVNREMMKRANEIIVVADHTKIGKESFCFVSDVSNISVLVSDAGADWNALEKIKEKGARVYQAALTVG